MLAKEVGKHLGGCKWVGVPFAGGMSELVHIDNKAIKLINDLHFHVINLGMVAANEELNQELRRRLHKWPVHPVALRQAQLRCQEREPLPEWKSDYKPDLEWAIDYFVCAWMARNGTAGTDNEFDTGMSIRWKTGGGDSAIRFRNATDALVDWQQILERATFSCLDAFEFLQNCLDRSDRPLHGIYCDAPWPEAGDSYKHKFTKKDQCRLALMLSKFKHAKVVVRYGDHPWIRKLYPKSHWDWHMLTGRKQTNDASSEVLLVNKI